MNTGRSGNPVGGCRSFHFVLQQTGTARSRMLPLSPTCILSTPRLHPSAPDSILPVPVSTLRPHTCRPLQPAPVRQQVSDIRGLREQDTGNRAPGTGHRGQDTENRAVCPRSATLHEAGCMRYPCTKHRSRDSSLQLFPSTLFPRMRLTRLFPAAPLRGSSCPQPLVRHPFGTHPHKKGRNPVGFRPSGTIGRD